jgi:hypothetical protein
MKPISNRFTGLSLSAELKIGVGILGLLVAILGGVAQYQTEMLWQNTQMLYTHPLALRRAVGDLDTDILSLQIDMKNLVLTSNRDDQQAIIQNIETGEVDALKQFDVLRAIYLGPQIDVERAYTDYVTWDSMRDDVVGMVNNEEIIAATSVVEPGGASELLASKLSQEVKTINDNSTVRADLSYTQAQTYRDSLRVQLSIILGAILLVGWGIAYLISRQIDRLVKELEDMTARRRELTREIMAGEASALTEKEPEKKAE